MQGEFLKDNLFYHPFVLNFAKCSLKDYLHGMEIHMKNGGLQPEGYIPLSNNQESTFMAMLVGAGEFTISLLQTTVHGRRRLNVVKIVLGLLCTVISFVFIYIIRLINVLNAYGTKGLQAPASSMEHLSAIP